jgi:ATP synthase I chain
MPDIEDEVVLPPQEPDPEAEAFYSRAMTRITRIMPVVAVLSTLAVLLRFQWQVGLGLAFGCFIAFVNFVSLKRVLTVLAERAAGATKLPSSNGMVLRFLLRYALIGIGCYAIFKVSRAGLYGLLAGLFLPVAAIGCEAVYELYAALRRGV